MAEPLDAALDRVRTDLLDPERLVRAVAAGRRRGGTPRWRRAELRYVDLKAGRRLQVTTYDETQAFTANHDAAAAPAAVAALLDEPFGNWHVTTVEQASATETQLRVTKKGEAVVQVARSDTAPVEERGHDRVKERLLPEDDPLLRVLGIADGKGRVKPTRQAKYRQVEEFLRALAAAVDDATAAGALRAPTPERPLELVDLGCGHAYLTFAAHRHLTARGLPTRLTGVDVKGQSLQHGTQVADRLGVGGEVRFVQGAIGSVALDVRPDVVLALHACDTATDDALASALRWEAPLVLAAPCCHHDVAAQLRGSAAPAPWSVLVRDGILRERFADTLTDALRAGTLREHGYRVDVVEFVESRHTPRNTLLRAVRTGAGRTPAAREELEELTRSWGVRPALQELLA